jgi:hypothetical protein
MERANSIMFFANGTTAVFDIHGQQLPRYQRGWHGTTIAALLADGIDWRTLPEQLGIPLRSPPAWWTPERQARHDAESESEGS